MSNYPERVVERANEALEALTTWCTDEPDVNPDVLHEELCKSLMSKWVDGTELIWLEEEILEIMKMAMVNSIIERLKTDGYVNSIEDEHGEEYLWTTAKGKAQLDNSEEAP